MKINSVIIDSTSSITDLCKLGTTYPTDKSPYCTDNYTTEHGSGHRHPYTAVYDMIFGPIRYKSIKIAEIGVLDCMSMLMWRDYFPNAKLYGFDNNPQFLKVGKSMGISDCAFSEIDVKSVNSIRTGLGENGRYDIIFEDSTHQFDDQIRVCEVAHDFLNPGGILIVEDIFKAEIEDRYAEKLENVMQYYSSVYFVNAEHAMKFSPGWDNDKLLILIRNNVK